MSKLNVLRAEIVADRAECTAECEAKRAALNAREKELERYEDMINAIAERQKRKQAKRVVKEKAKEEARISRRLFCFNQTPTLCVPRDFLDAEIERVKHTQGMITTVPQSRCILLMVFACVEKGSSSTEANQEVCGYAIWRLFMFS